MEGKLVMYRPTKATPGSAEKLRIMRERLAAGRDIFHPKDSRFEHARYTDRDRVVSLHALRQALDEGLGLDEQ